jgi:hypothetical protein
LPYKNINHLDGIVGSGLRYLKNIPIATIQDGDIANVISGNENLIFIFDSDGVSAEQTTTHPWVIRPTDFITQGIWIEKLPSGVSNGYNGSIVIGTKTLTIVNGLITNVV